MSATAFIRAQGLGRHGWARTLGTLALMIVLAVLAALAARGGAFPILRTTLADAPEPIRSGALALVAGALFGSALIGLLIGVRFLHGRPARSVVTTARRFRWLHLILGFLVSAGLVGALGYLLDPEGLKPLDTLPIGTLALSALMLLAGFAIQAPTEEVLFRGYILQVGWRGFRSPWLTAGLSVVLFTLFHFGYGIESALFSLISAVGLLIVVLLLDGLELTMGAHVGNNLIVAFLFQDLSNANAPSASGIAWDELAANAGVMTALILLALALRRRSTEPR